MPGIENQAFNKTELERDPATQISWQNDNEGKQGTAVEQIQMPDLPKVQDKFDNEERSSKVNLGNTLAVGLATFWSTYNTFISKHKQVLQKLTLVVLVLVLLLYVGAVIRQFLLKDSPNIDWCRGYGMAFIIFGLIGWTLTFNVLVVPCFLPYLISCSRNHLVKKTWKKAQLAVVAVLVIVLVAFLVWDTSSDRRRLISIGGLFIFIACGFIFSKHPTHVKWRTVFMGLAIQFIMGLFAIRWRTGRDAFKCVGGLAQEFLEYSYIGATLVYGERNVRVDGVFAFQALSAIFFVSMIVQVLFYLGWMQVMCQKLGWLIQVAMGTTIMESVNAVSSVFLGMSEAPLLYKPYIKDLTASEIHAVMVGGFSTIAGTMFAVYTSFGVDPSHIITASMMTAPAALCYAKLVYPETSVSKTDLKSVKFIESTDKSIMDAAVQGASIGINMFLGIVATVIACVSVVAVFNDILAWLGLLAGIEDFTLETILAYLLFPVVWLMGVDSSQCLLVSRLIGIKLSVNEFVGYQKLGEIQKTGVLSPRTEAIATYAMCSFANPGSLGIFISTLTTLEPLQRFNIIQVSLRAFVASVVVSFLTACIAGALTPEEGFMD